MWLDMKLMIETKKICVVKDWTTCSESASYSKLNSQHDGGTHRTTQ